MPRDLDGETPAVDRFVVRLSADPVALARIRGRLEPPRLLWLVVTQYGGAAITIVASLYRIGMDERHAWFAWFTLAYGFAYGPVAFFFYNRQREKIVFLPVADDELVIDDAGLTMVRGETRIPWSRISAVRDLGEAFVFVRGYTVSHIVLFTADLPDGGRALWNALDARLVSTTGLVRGTSSRTTISHTAR